MFAATNQKVLRRRQPLHDGLYPGGRSSGEYRYPGSNCFRRRRQCQGSCSVFTTSDVSQLTRQPPPYLIHSNRFQQGRRVRKTMQHVCCIADSTVFRHFTSPHWYEFASTEKCEEGTSSKHKNFNRLGFGVELWTPVTSGSIEDVHNAGQWEVQPNITSHEKYMFR